MGSRLLRKFGEFVDRRYLKKVNATTIPGSENKLLLFCYHPYQGKSSLELPDAVIINPGDPVAELHLNNIRITEIAAEPLDRPLEWRLINMLKEELISLGRACNEDLIPKDVKGFYGVNVLTVGAKRLGFTLVPIPKGFGRWWMGFWESILRVIYYSHNTKKKATVQRTMDPYEVWISRDEVVRRFLKASQKTIL